MTNLSMEIHELGQDGYPAYQLRHVYCVFDKCIVSLQVHRRLLVDDNFGVGEALNEHGITGKGLVVRGEFLYFLNITKASYFLIHLAFTQDFLIHLAFKIIHTLIHVTVL